MANPIVLIPARLASTRLPEKPLALIAGSPMILHVWRRALAAAIGPVVVATDSDRIAAIIRSEGGTAVMTAAEHPSGTDRIFEALQRYDPDGRHDVIVNVQGDLPTVAPEVVRAALLPLIVSAVHIATLAAPLAHAAEADDPNVVKVVGTPSGPERLRALYFTRARAPWGEGVLLHHIGLYAYRRESLQHFVALPPSGLEQREKLEQLRALEAGMRIDVQQVDTVPFGVDTQADLARAEVLLSNAR